MIKINFELGIPSKANPEFAGLSSKEKDFNGGWRIIRGTFADLYFRGFIVKDDRTVLLEPHLKLFNPEETEQGEGFLGLLAQAILLDDFEAIGVRSVEQGCYLKA